MFINLLIIFQQFVGLVISIPYSGRFEELDQRDIQNVEGLLYLTITETIFLFIYAVFITFPSEVPILLRETASGLYSPTPYYLSKMIFWVSVLGRALFIPYFNRLSSIRVDLRHFRARLIDIIASFWYSTYVKKYRGD